MRTRSRIPGGLKPKQTKQVVNSTLFEYPPDRADQESSRNVIIFTKHDHQQLQSPRFLNDTIISFFMQYYLDHKVDPQMTSRIHIFNSFFFAKIKSLGKRKKSSTIPTYEHMSRWLKSVKLFTKDFLILPVCEKDHWLLIIVCYPANLPRRDSHKIPDEELHEPAVLVLNSCAGLAPPLKKALGQFLKYQWQQEHNTPRNFNINQAKNRGIRLVFPDLPQQKNSYNCGVYLLGYFYSFLKDPRQAYINMYRNRSLKAWFSDNNIDISRERTRMINLVRVQISTWAKSAKATCDYDQDTANGSQDVSLNGDTQSHGSDLSEIIENGSSNGIDQHVIVIH